MDFDYFWGDWEMDKIFVKPNDFMVSNDLKMYCCMRYVVVCYRKFMARPQVPNDDIHNAALARYTNEYKKKMQLYLGYVIFSHIKL